jgi:hypothetical protein
LSTEGNDPCQCDFKSITQKSACIALNINYLERI